MRYHVLLLEVLLHADDVRMLKCAQDIDLLEYFLPAEGVQKLLRMLAGAAGTACLLGSQAATSSKVRYEPTMRIPCRVHIAMPAVLYSKLLCTFKFATYLAISCRFRYTIDCQQSCMMPSGTWAVTKPVLSSYSASNVSKIQEKAEKAAHALFASCCIRERIE